MQPILPSGQRIFSSLSRHASFLPYTLLTFIRLMASLTEPKSSRMGLLCQGKNHLVSISKERTYKFAFQKHLILKEIFWRAQAKHKPPNSLPQKRKAGASSRTRNVVIYSIKYS